MKKYKIININYLKQYLWYDTEDELEVKLTKN